MANLPASDRYLDYRQWIRACMANSRGGPRRLTLEHISRAAGGLTKSHLSLILAGKRNLNEEKAIGVGKAIGLRGDELTYFERLVRFNQAQNEGAREHYLHQLIETKKRKSPAQAAISDLRLLDSWHCLVVLEALRTNPALRTPGQIAAHLRNLLTAGEAQAALEALQKSGAVERTTTAYRVKPLVLRSSDEVTSLSIRRYHRACLRLGDAVLDRVPLENREFGSLNISLSKAGVRRVKAKLKELSEEILAMVAEDTGPTDTCQLNFQFFSLNEANGRTH